jgi:hypothetical protein
LVLTGDPTLILRFVVDPTRIAVSGPACTDSPSMSKSADPGARILALGGVPGSAYSPPEFTELGGPEPGPPKQ